MLEERQQPAPSSAAVDSPPEGRTEPVVLTEPAAVRRPVATNLPVQLTPLIGRQQEIAAVSRLLRESQVRLVTLTGPGGIGKTRLALQVATELVEQYADGVFLVALAPVSKAEQVLPAILQTLDISEQSGQAPLSRLKAALKDKHMLVLLDNFEQVSEAAVPLSDLLAACPRLTLLVTSQVLLHLQAEREFSVPPLSLPNPRHLPDLVTLSQYEAVALFIQRAQAVKAEFTVTNANAPAVAEICARLDGLPLAIELAAARVKFFAPQALLARLEQSLALLVGGARDLPSPAANLAWGDCLVVFLALAPGTDPLPAPLRLRGWLELGGGRGGLPGRRTLGAGCCWRDCSPWPIRACCARRSQQRGNRASGCYRCCAPLA